MFLTSKFGILNEYTSVTGQRDTVELMLRLRLREITVLKGNLTVFLAERIPHSSSQKWGVLDITEV